MTDKTGGPAFPVPSNTLQTLPEKTLLSGMTLRDYFAAKAVQSVLLDLTSSEWDYASIAMAAYEVADAMLVERAK